MLRGPEMRLWNRREEVTVPKFTCNLISYTLRRAVDITVVIPSPTIPESTHRAQSASCMHTPRAPYPVLYLLHGMGNNHATWTGYTNVELFAEERSIAVVNLSGENKGYVPRGKDDYFRFVSEELPDFICGMFPVSRRAEDTYLAGLSMGGYGTLIHGLNFPERYAAIGTFSGAVALPPGDQVQPEDLENGQSSALQDGGGDSKPLFEPYALAEKLSAEKRRIPPIYMACGTEDFLYRGNLKFRDHLLKMGAEVTWDEIEGYGHEWRFWNLEVERFLDWIPRTDFYAGQGRRSI